jgi:ABC-type nitrate/sulfonate/bicarbonate transport system ATPase subunit
MLLLDEPFGMLDSLTRYELQAVLLELWRKERITAMMVTHDVDEALYLSDRVVLHDRRTRGDHRRNTSPYRSRGRAIRKAVMEHAEYPPASQMSDHVP